MVRHQRRADCVRMRAERLRHQPSVRPHRELRTQLRGNSDGAAHPEQHDANLRLHVPV
jgi:hypothetical protein